MESIGDCTSGKQLGGHGAAPLRHPRGEGSDRPEGGPRCV